MPKSLLHRLVIGAFLIAAGAVLLAAGHPAGLAWALIIWALFVVASAPEAPSTRGRRERTAPPPPRR